MRSVSTATCALAFAVVLVSASSGWSTHDDSGCESHPANDDYGNATDIPFVPYATAGSTICATREPGEPEPWCEGVYEPSTIRSSVWYRFRPTETGRLTVHVLGVTPVPLSLAFLIATERVFPAVIHVYEGESFEAKKYSCHASAGLLAQASFLAVERKTYYIQVSPMYTWPRGEGDGDFVLLLAPRIETDPREILP